MFSHSILAQLGQPSAHVILTLSFCTTIASVVGFGIGYWYGKNNLRWQIRKLARDASRFLPAVLQQLEAAEQACRRLNSIPKLNLNSRQTEQLERKQSGLIDSLGQVLSRLKPSSATTKATAKPQEPVPLNWQLAPVDHSLDIPDSSTVTQNLENLVGHLKQNQQTGGLLLLKMNKQETFKERFGPASTEHLFKQLTELAQASLREEDLVVRLDDDTLCLFLPETDLSAGTKFSHQLRHTVRHGSFRLNTSDSEVLLTASFGYAFCRPTDSSDQVMNRAIKALKHSESKGRNQLFVHSGSSVPRCVTTP
ncbi:response regulator PleD [Polystyrenella longa]|uniref:Response regulator PleD n=1 Tax=Polystyrenella longa TaxID=2528007 RepID=A0A518CM92_9PLAN|nr:diguanylate cyclase [Polystyrenella longa]QDU80313.1 response regulator PleD [Polystyrenella longa]